MRKTQSIITFLLLLMGFYSNGESINFIVKAKITTNDNHEYSGYFVKSFPTDFHFKNKETLEMIKSNSSDSLFLEQIKIISDGKYIFKFSNSYYSTQRFGINDIKSIHVEKYIIDPFPVPYLSLNNNDFDILKNQLNKIQFITCSEYYPRLPLYFSLLSFSSDKLLNDCLKRTKDYLTGAAESGNMTDLMKNINNLEQVCKKDKILFIKGMKESSYYKFDNPYNIEHGIDINVFNDF